MLDIDTAIKHCEEEAEKYMEYGIETECYQCGKDHEQLASWLKELKELEAKHWDECRQIAHYDDELEEAKRLLKLALQDMNSNNICYDINACNVCTENKRISCNTFRWRYTDEVKRLLRGGDTNG